MGPVPNRQRWDQLEAEALEMRRAGRSMPEIVEALGVSKEFVAKAAQRAGLVRPPRWSPRRTPEMDRRDRMIHDLVGWGARPAEIAWWLGISGTRVGQILQRPRP